MKKQHFWSIMHVGLSRTERQRLEFARSPKSPLQQFLLSDQARRNACTIRQENDGTITILEAVPRVRKPARSGGSKMRILRRRKRSQKVVDEAVKKKSR